MSKKIIIRPKPLWGYRFLVWAERTWPRWLWRPIFGLGVWIAVWKKEAESHHSRDYLSVVYGREMGWWKVWRHFQIFTELLMLRLRVARGEAHRYTMEPENKEGFDALVKSNEPVLWGTFHFGHSDLMGFALAEKGRRISMIRLRGTDAGELMLLGDRFGGVNFVWVNNPTEVLFALKECIQAGDSVALQCDRVRHAAKTAVFDFLDAKRVFPFTIYHLALMFGRPVMFCLGLPDATDGTRVIATPVFRAQPSLSRAENLRRAHDHFQGVLARLETLVRQYPELWFNFIPLNPEEASLPARATTDVA